MKLTKFMPLAALLGLTAAVAVAQDDEKATLKIGDPAPKLQVGKWVQGTAVKDFSKDNAYIVEFWATWCGPCKASIPHLNEIYTKYKDKGLIVIGQDCFERDEAKVAPFVKDMGEKMTYRVALDDKSSDKEGAMATTWMKAAAQNGIPTAFIVEKTGKIAWIGHPMEMEDSVIQAVLDGKYDLKAAQAKYEKAKTEADAGAQLQRQLGKAMQNKDWDKAEATVKEISKQIPEDQRDEFVDGMHFTILLSKGDLDGAAQAADKLAGKAKGDATKLNSLAWPLVSHEGCKGTALDIAAKLAERANDASGGKDAPIIDTLARARFLQGKKDEAIALQKKAVSLADGDMKDDLKKTLESYEAGKLPAAE
jgi:thiol-disulfide isomerase/thioredoxin